MRGNPVLATSRRRHRPHLIAPASLTAWPGVAAGLWYAGGTYAWYEELAPKCAALNLSTTELSEGALLLRRYRDEADQGHLCVVWTDGRIIHCWPDKGVVIEEMPADYFEYVCVGWLTAKS